MADINLNLRNLKLQNLQLSKTVNVDTQKAEGKNTGDAKPSAVWYGRIISDRAFLYDNLDGSRPKAKAGDLVLNVNDGKYYKITDPKTLTYEEFEGDSIDAMDYYESGDHHDQAVNARN